jgi:isoquinoline 1-oxidoreductase beta subunit
MRRADSSALREPHATDHNQWRRARSAPTRVEQSNYTDYLVPRIDITPHTHVYFVENTHLPGGVGEPGVPPTAPAICNAISAATGKRIRALPVDPQQLKA